jgi:hypothetical protein
MNTGGSKQWGDAWLQLQQVVEAQTRTNSAPETPRLRWSPGRLALIGTWQVEARFVERSGAYEVLFDRFGAQLGSVNFELPPGARVVPPDIWRLQPIDGTTQTFWRINDGQDLLAERLAMRIVEHLKDFYQTYRLAAVGA